MVSSVLAQAILSQQAPDIVGSFNRGRETARKEQTRDLAGIIASGKGTQEQFSELAGLDPQVALTLQQQLGARDLHDTNETIKSANIAYNLATQSSPQAAMEYLNQRGAILSSQGRDTTQTDTIARQFQADPQGAIQQLSSFRDAVNFGKQSGETVRQREFAQWQRMEPGPDKDAFGRIIQATTKRESIEGAAERAERLAYAKQFGKGGAKIEQDPLIAKAVELAKGNAKTFLEKNKAERSNASAFAMYESAIGDLTTALSETVTGPSIGYMPAITSDAQVAEGAISMLRPLLKGMFRQAGEGTFTDKDQEVLERMLPTRNDLPEARTQKLMQLDRLIRAKLQQPAAPEVVPGQQDNKKQGGVIMTDANGNRAMVYPDGSFEELN